MATNTDTELVCPHCGESFAAEAAEYQGYSDEGEMSTPPVVICPNCGEEVKTS